MAPILSQSEIQEITRLLEQGTALPEKYRDVLFVDQKLHSEDSTAGNPELAALAERPVEPPKPQSNETNSTASFVKFLLDNPRIQEVIKKHLGMVVPVVRNKYTRNPLGGLADECTNEIAEIAPQILQQPGNEQYLLKWQNTTKQLAFSENPKSEVFHTVRRMLYQRESEMIRDRKAKEARDKIEEKVKENESIEGLLAKYADIVDTFLAIAERKVSVFDEYGDERMYLLPNLVDDCVAKIAGREGKSEIHIRTELKKGGIYLQKRHKELLRIRERLPALFAKYHEEQKGRKKTTEEMASLSGIDFETAVGRVLLEHGWHVSATAATGDQGADRSEERRV